MLDRANEEYKERQLSVHDPVLCPIISLCCPSIRNRPRQWRFDLNGGLGPCEGRHLENVKDDSDSDVSN